MSLQLCLTQYKNLNKNKIENNKMFLFIEVFPKFFIVIKNIYNLNSKKKDMINIINLIM